MNSVQNKIEKVQKVFLKEYFYLHDTEVYEELNNYIENDLYDTFDGKLLNLYTILYTKILLFPQEML